MALSNSGPLRTNALIILLVIVVLRNQLRHPDHAFRHDEVHDISCRVHQGEVNIDRKNVEAWFVDAHDVGGSPSDEHVTKEHFQDGRAQQSSEQAKAEAEVAGKIAKEAQRISKSEQELASESSEMPLHTGQHIGELPREPVADDKTSEPQLPQTLPHESHGFHTLTKSEDSVPRSPSEREPKGSPHVDFISLSEWKEQVIQDLNKVLEEAAKSKKAARTSKKQPQQADLEYEEEEEEEEEETTRDLGNIEKLGIDKLAEKIIGRDKDGVDDTANSHQSETQKVEHQQIVISAETFTESPKLIELKYPAFASYSMIMDGSSCVCSVSFLGLAPRMECNDCSLPPGISYYLGGHFSRTTVNISSSIVKNNSSKSSEDPRVNDMMTNDNLSYTRSSINERRAQPEQHLLPVASIKPSTTTTASHSFYPVLTNTSDKPSLNASPLNPGIRTRNESTSVMDTVNESTNQQPPPEPCVSSLPAPSFSRPPKSSGNGQVEAFAGISDKSTAKPSADKLDTSRLPSTHFEIEPQPPSLPPASGNTVSKVKRRKKKKAEFDFANIDAGARVVAYSESAMGAKNVIVSDNEKYMLARCDSTRFVVLELSEDIIFRSVVISNQEIYSSNARYILILSSQTYPTETWSLLEGFPVDDNKKSQRFNVAEANALGRYMKVVFVGHHRPEYYCTVTQISVYGKRLIDDWREAFEADSEDLLADRLSQKAEQKERSADVVIDGDLHFGGRTRETIQSSTDDGAGKQSNDLSPNRFASNSAQSAKSETLASASVSFVPDHPQVLKSENIDVEISEQLAWEKPSTKYEGLMLHDKDGSGNDGKVSISTDHQGAKKSIPDKASDETAHGAKPILSADGRTERFDEGLDKYQHDLSSNVPSAKPEKDIRRETPIDAIANERIPHILPSTVGDAVAPRTQSRTEHSALPRESSSHEGRAKPGLPPISQVSPKLDMELDANDKRLLALIAADAFSLTPNQGEESMFRKLTRMVRSLELNQSLTNRFIDMQMARFSHSIGELRTDLESHREETKQYMQSLSETLAQMQARQDEFANAMKARDYIQIGLSIGFCMALFMLVALHAAFQKRSLKARDPTPNFGGGSKSPGMSFTSDHG